MLRISDFLPYLDVAVNVVVAVFAMLVIPIWRHLQTLRANDLAHLDEKIQALQHTCDEINRKLDRHIEYHLHAFSPPSRGRGEEP